MAVSKEVDELDEVESEGNSGMAVLLEVTRALPQKFRGLA
jgi:hypothetical protein